jgi:hypothetical protein
VAKGGRAAALLLLLLARAGADRCARHAPRAVPQVRLVAEDSVEQRVLEMQQWKLKHGLPPAASAAQEFEGTAVVQFFGDM